MNSYIRFKTLKYILKIKKKLSFMVKGNCMSGIFEEGSIIDVVGIDVRSIKIGDILAVFKNDKYYAHRVIDIIYDSVTTKKLFILKGDNSSIVDLPIKEEEIIGIVIT